MLRSLPTTFVALALAACGGQPQATTPPATAPLSLTYFTMKG